MDREKGFAREPITRVGPADDTEAIREMYRTYWRCMIAKDADGLRGLMSDDCILTHMTGVRQSREAFLKGLMNGTFRYFSADHGPIEVTVRGDRAALTGKSRVVAAVYGGEKRAWRLRGDFALRRENGRWSFTGSEASIW